VPVEEIRAVLEEASFARLDHETDSAKALQLTQTLHSYLEKMRLVEVPKEKAWNK
jgi:hypothetical protein